jgi:hypothetical protein
MEIEFVVEDGTGLSNATSYVSALELQQYWFNIGYSFESLTDNDIKRLLNKSTAYIDSNYVKGFPGYRVSSTQRLEWGREGAYYTDGYDIESGTVPREIKNAVNEMAYLINQGVDPNATISKDGKVISESVSVDVIKESVKYQEGSSMYQDIYTSVDNALYRITGGVNDNFILDIMRDGGDSP